MSTPYPRDIIADTIATNKIGSKVAGGTLTLGSSLGKLALSNAATVTQITSIATGVAFTNGNSGVITTFSAVTAADAVSVFTVTHPSVLTTSVVLANIVNYAGTGLPCIAVKNLTNGTFDIAIQNGAAAAALNNVLKIGFVVLN